MPLFPVGRGVLMMSICILTNTSALFPPASSIGARFIRVMTLDTDERDIILPDLDDFNRIYNELEREFNAILVLTASETILPIFKTAQLSRWNRENNCAGYDANWPRVGNFSPTCCAEGCCWRFFAGSRRNYSGCYPIFVHYHLPRQYSSQPGWEKQARAWQFR
jgi:hypothetical protein